VKLWPLVVMPFSMILLAAGLMSRNPSAVGQGLGAPRRPRRHGGDFLGGLAFVALAGTKLIDRRKDETLGEDWKRFAAVTSNVPFTAIVEGRNRLVLGELGGKRIAAGIIAFAILLLAHPYLFRVRAW
jgi:uncharacterized membrane protein